jgi:ABC-type uncharacterized transport system substrate-binding protein
MACFPSLLWSLLFSRLRRRRRRIHVWVTVHSEVVYGSDGIVKGVRHAWTFDDMFSAFAVQGIAHAKDGELRRLAAQ